MEPKLTLLAPFITTPIHISACHKEKETPLDYDRNPAFVMPASEVAKRIGRWQAGGIIFHIHFPGIERMKADQPAMPTSTLPVNAIPFQEQQACIRFTFKSTSPFIINNDPTDVKALIKRNLRK